MHTHFATDVEVVSFSEQMISLKHLGAKLELSQPDSALTRILQRLISGGASEETLLDEWMEESGDLSRFYFVLEKMRRMAFFSYSVFHEGKPLCTLTPYKECHFKLLDLFELDTISFQLSRFAFIRNRNGALICETPLAAACIELKSSHATTLLLALAKPQTWEELMRQCPEIPTACLKELVELLYRASFLEVENPALATWDFHDLLFHTRSRRGRHGDLTATHFRFLDKMPPLPPLKPMPENTKWIPLFTPDIASLKGSDLSFTQVLETRQSIRTHGDRPITLKELGEFLYRSARVKGEKSASHYEATTRPSPGGGACHELELYPLVHCCEGLEKGLYYYHPGRHALTLLREWNGDIEELLAATSRSTGKKELPQMAILIASRFRRLAWKYQSMAYSTTLKDTGALMQTLYLVATAMGLAPCSVGAGNSDLFAKAAKTNYYEETTVGEFLLGSRSDK